MPRIATRHAHKLAYRRRLSLGVRMLGCLVMLAGAIVLAAALAEFAKGPLSREARLMVSLGVVLSLVGASLFCGERGILIDRETRTLKRWWGVIVPLRRAFDDISQYQAVGFCACADSALPCWRVCLYNSQGEQLELFDLDTEQVAVFAARQVASFLSLPLAPLPSAGVGGTTAVPVAAGLAMNGALPEGRLWAYRSHFGLVPRGIGTVCLVLGLVLTAGLLSAANLGHARWLILFAAVLPLCLVGLWLFVGGRRVLIDADGQIVKIWRAWPLPPAIYELASFYAVMIAPEDAAVSDQESLRQLIGLIGAEQLRLELVRGLPRDEAIIIATEVAAVARLPLVDEPLPTHSASA